MPNLLKCKVSVTVSAPTEKLKRCNGLWAFVTPQGNPEKVLGQAQINASGTTEIKLKLSGIKPIPMDVLIYPLSSLAGFKRIKTEKSTVATWKKTSTELTTEVKIKLTDLFFSSISWLDEVFTIEGRLLNRFTDPETDTVREVPIYHSLVKLFDVDKKKGITINCVPNRLCRPLITECIPKKLCTPMNIHCLPKDICIPKITCNPNQICTPDITCIPNTICQPDINCRPLYEIEYDPFKDFPYELDLLKKYSTLKTSTLNLRQGCCGSESMSSMKPANSPALAVINTKLNADIACIPHLLNKTTYTKTQLSTTFETESDGRFWFQFTRKDFFDAAAGSTHTEDLDWDEFPDVLFEAHLGIEGSLKLIYREPNTETRWNQGLYLYVDLYVEGDLNLSSSDSQIDPNQVETFLFHGIGNVEPGWINSEGIIKTAPDTTELNEHVFGGRLHIKGQFNNDHLGKHYQVEYQRAGDTSWHVVTGEQWYYSEYMGNNQWQTRLKSPVTLSGIEGCYPIPDYTDINITQKELLIPWTSFLKDGNIPRYPNGHYRLRVNLIENTSPGHYAIAPVATYNPMVQILNIMIDNNWPIADFSDQLYVGQNVGGTLNLSPVAPCGFVQGGTNKYLILNFTAVDLEKHFWKYYIRMNRGSDGYIPIPDSGLPNTINTNPSLAGFKLSPSTYFFSLPTDNFQNGYVALNLGTDPWLGGNHIKQCAYNFTLTVYDRVTNGYGPIHWSHHPVTLTITE